MRYTKPSILNVKQASIAIKAQHKERSGQDGANLVSTINAYQSDE